MKAKPKTRPRSVKRAPPLDSAPATATTVSYEFGPISSNGPCLFSVRGGIPISDAFDQLSTYLSATKESIEMCAMAGDNIDDVPGVLWQSAYLLDFSKALVEAMHSGVMAHERRTSV